MSGSIPDHLRENWPHAGRLIRGAAHEINNHLGAILAYSDLISAAPGAAGETRRMAAEIAIAARESATQLETLSALVSLDLVSVETIHLNELLPRIRTLFRSELEHEKSGIELVLPDTVCAFPGVRTRIVRALVHTIRYAADSPLAAPRPRKIGVRLSHSGEAFRIDIGGAGFESASPPLEFPEALAEAREHVRFHRGDLICIAPGYARLEVPQDTGIIKHAPTE